MLSETWTLYLFGFATHKEVCPDGCKMAAVMSDITSAFQVDRKPSPKVFLLFLEFPFPTDSTSTSSVRSLSCAHLAEWCLETWRGSWIRLMLDELSYSIYHTA